MNWYKCAKTLETSNPSTHNKLLKSASISLYVDGFERPHDLKNIQGICYYLASELNNNYKFNIEELNDWIKNGHPSEFFSPDGDDASKSTGIINNYVKAFPRKQIGLLVNQTINALKKANLAIQDVKYEKSTDSNEIRVVRYTISSNPNAKKIVDMPPEMNISNGSADTMVIILLGKRLDPNGATINAFGAVNTIDQIKNATDVINKIRSTKTVNKTDINADGAEWIFQRLQEVRQIAQWAIDHNFKDIYFA